MNPFDRTHVFHKKPAFGSARYAAPDTLRGLVLISMVMYHGAWDLVNLYGLRMAGFNALAGYTWQQSICWSFILLSGFCFPLGKHHLKRGLELLFCGSLITLVTSFVAGSLVLFGILFFLGSAQLLTIGLSKIKLAPVFGFVGSMFLFLIFRTVASGTIGIGGIDVTLPSFLYSSTFSAYLGFPPSSFYSNDYFALLPWLFLYFAGFYMYGLFGKRLCKTYKKDNILTFLGRHALGVYLLHQPVLLGLFALCVR